MSAAHTPGPWKAVAMGGSSTVVVPSKPKRNDSRIPAFGYDEQRGHCIAYPFTNDDGTTRLDFVCFSHDDARLIAAAPALLEALDFMVNVSRSTPGFSPMAREQAERAITLAKGESA